jgi:hypothetical protein
MEKGKGRKRKHRIMVHDLLYVSSIFVYSTLLYPKNWDPQSFVFEIMGLIVDAKFLAQEIWYYFPMVKKTFKIIVS